MCWYYQINGEFLIFSYVMIAERNYLFNHLDRIVKPFLIDLHIFKRRQLFTSDNVKLSEVNERH